MAKAKLTFNILSYWHAGTGMGEGSNLDAVVAKTAEQIPIPYLPGKTVKGLFREALRLSGECGRLAGNTTLSYLGGQMNDRFDSKMACLEFSNATLGENMETWAIANQNTCRHFYRRISATCIDDDGQAKTDTLRTIEVTIPLTLTAFVESFDIPKEWIDDLKMAAPFVRYIGSHRHRGLGRAIVTVVEV